MGITDFHWETCPRGIEKGGWGLYIKPEDLAKLGQLVMDGGLWQGERLLSRAYIDAAATAYAVPPETAGDFNYGYQIWWAAGKTPSFSTGCWARTCWASGTTASLW